MQKKTICRILALVMVTAMVLSLLPTTVLAASNLDNGFEGQDADIFTALGFDTSVIPEGIDMESTENPYGRDRVLGNQVSELLIADNSAAKIYGVDDNNVDPAKISGSPSGGTGIGMQMYASAAGDFDGDGLPGEVVYVGYDGLNPSNRFATLAIQIYDAKTDIYGTKKQIGRVSPYYTVPPIAASFFDTDTFANQQLYEDANWQNLLQVTAGDYDGDGTYEIAAYIGDNEKARIDIFKYQKTSRSGEDDWMDMHGNWSRAWSHALSGEFSYVPNMVSLVSGDFNRDGIDDLALSYGNAVFNFKLDYLSLPSTLQSLYDATASKAYVLWGSHDSMLQSNSKLNLNEEEFGEQARVSLIAGDLNLDGSKELIATGQPLADLEAFQNYPLAENGPTSKLYSKDPMIGNNQRSIVSYIYDETLGLVPDLTLMSDIVNGKFEENTVEGETYITWNAENGFNEKYYSMPFMRTNSAVFKPAGSDYAYLYLDSCLFQNAQGSLQLTDQIDDSLSKISGLSGTHEFWGADAWDGDRLYSEYGAAAADINGNGDEVLVTGFHDIAYSYPTNTVSIPKYHHSGNGIMYGVGSRSLGAHLTMQSAEDNESYYSTAMTFVDCDVDTVIMEYTGNHFLTYSDPKILAVIACPPYFEDVDATTGYESTSNNSTSWGQTTGEGDTLGFTQDFSIGYQHTFAFGAGGVDMELALGGAYTLSYDNVKSHSYEYTMTYSANANEDAVVMYSVPSDNYVFNVKTPDGKGGYNEEPYTVTNCLRAVNQVLTLDDYEAIRVNYPDFLPQVAGKALKSTPGVPSSYPSSESGYKEIERWNKDDRTPAGIGFGNGSISQEMAVGEEHEIGYTMGGDVTWELGFGSKIQVDVGQTIFDSSNKITGHLNPQATWSNVDISGSTFSGEIVNMPLEFQQYGYYFAWSLFAYEYEYSRNGESLSIPVVTYIVNDVVDPPHLPQDFEQDYDRTTSDTNVLSWTYEDACSNFILYKYFDFPVGGGLQEIARIDPTDPANYRILYDEDGKPYKEFYFEDTNLSPYTEYQYSIQVERLSEVPPLSTPSALYTARTKSATGYPSMNIVESDDEDDGTMLVYADRNAFLEVAVAGPEGEKASNYYSVVQYQWQKQDENGAWNDLIGETTRTLSFVSPGKEDEGAYRCLVNVITKADNHAISAYTDSVKLEQSKRTSYFDELGLRDLAGGGIEFYATVCNAHPDSASIPGGSVIFTARSNSTGSEYSVSAPLNGNGIASTVFDDQLPEGMYTVKATYVGSYVFKSCTAESLYLSQRGSGFDIDLPAETYYGDGEDVIFRAVTKSGGVTSAVPAYAESFGLFSAASLSRTQAAYSQTLNASPADVTAGTAYRYVDEDGISWYFTAPESGEATMDTEHGIVLLHDRSAYLKMDPTETGTYLLAENTPAADYIIRMTGKNPDGSTEEALAHIAVLPRPITFQISTDMKAGESESEPMDDIYVRDLELVNGSWADCDCVNGAPKAEFLARSIEPEYLNTAGTSFTAEDVRDFCGSYSIRGTAEIENYDVTYLAGKLIVLGAAHHVNVATRYFEDQSVGTAYIISPEYGGSRGTLADGDSYVAVQQTGARLVFTAVPDAGFEIYDWYINGEAQNSRSSTFIHTLLNEDTTVEVQFVISRNTLTFGKAGDAEGGTLLCSDSSLTNNSSVIANSHFFFTAEAKEGYHFKEWRYTELGKGTAYDAEDYGKQTSQFELLMPSCSCSLYAVFERDFYTVSYADESGNDGLTAEYVNEEGVRTAVIPGSSVKGGTEITVAPKPGYVFDPEYRYSAEGTQGVPENGTYVLTLDEDTSIRGWTLREAYDVTLRFDAVRTTGQSMDAKILYTIDDEEHEFIYTPEAPSLVLHDVPGGTAITAEISAPDWMIRKGWTDNATSLTASTEPDRLAVAAAQGDEVRKDQAYYYEYNDGTGNVAYYFTSPVSGILEFSGENVTVYSAAQKFTIAALASNDTIAVHLVEKPAYTVQLRDIRSMGAYSAELPDGALVYNPLQSGRFYSGTVTVHDGDDLTLLVTPDQGNTVAYWKTTPEDGAAVTSRATSLKYTIPHIDRNFTFEPVFTSTTYNTISWTGLSSIQDYLTLTPEPGYVTSLSQGKDFRFRLNGSALPFVDKVFANGHELTAAGNVVAGTTYQKAGDVYVISNIRSNIDISVTFKPIGITVNGTDISAFTGNGWSYNPQTQCLALTKTGVRIGGANDPAFAPELHIDANENVGTVTIDGLKLNAGDSAAAAIVLHGENVSLSVTGSNKLGGIYADHDLTIRGNGSLELSNVSDAAAIRTEGQLTVTGSAAISISAENCGIRAFALNVGALNSASSNPTLRISAASSSGNCIEAPNVNIYSGEMDLQSNAVGLLSNDVHCYGGTLDIEAEGNAVIAFNKLARLVAAYEKGYVLRYLDPRFHSVTNYATTTRLTSEYNGSEYANHAIAGLNSGEDLVTYPTDYATGSTIYMSAVPNVSCVRLSPLNADVDAAETGLNMTISVDYNGKTYTAPIREDGNYLYLLDPDNRESNELIVLANSEGSEYIDDLRFAVRVPGLREEQFGDGMMQNLYSFSENSLIVAESFKWRDLPNVYFNVAKLKKGEAVTLNDVSGQSVTAAYYYHPTLAGAEDIKLDYTVSGVLRPTRNDDSGNPGYKYMECSIVASGEMAMASRDVHPAGERTDNVASLTLNSLVHTNVQVGDYPVYLEGDSYLIGTENNRPLTAADGRLDLRSKDGTGTLTVLASPDANLNRSALAADTLELHNVRSLTLYGDNYVNILAPKTAAKMAFSFYDGDTELPYGLGWLEDAGKDARTSTTLQALDIECELPYARFYSTTSDAKLTPNAFAMDKTESSVSVRSAELTIPAVAGKPHPFTPGKNGSGVRINETGEELAPGTDYTFSGSRLTLNYDADVFKALKVGSYTLTVSFFDEDPADATYYTVEAPLEVTDIRHSSGDLTVAASGVSIKRGDSVELTTAFTGTTPKTYQWSCEQPGVTLTDNGSTAKLQIGSSAAFGSFTVRVKSFADADMLDQLGEATVTITVVPQAENITISCAGETPSGDESFMLYHNTLDGSTKTWKLSALVKLDDGTTSSDVTWSLRSATRAATLVDPATGLLAISPSETGTNGAMHLVAAYSNKDGSVFSKTVRIYLSTDSMVGYEVESDGGVITAAGVDPSGTLVESGAKIVFSAFPDEGYAVDQWFVNGTAVKNCAAYSIDEAAGTMTLTAASSRRYIVSASFAGTAEYAVTFSAGENGAVTAACNDAALESGAFAAKNAKLTFTAVPDDFCRVARWYVNGVKQNSAQNTLVIDSLSGNVNVTVEFEAPERKVAVTADGNGAVRFLVNGEPAEAAFRYGMYTLTAHTTDTVTILANADKGFAVADWTLPAAGAEADNAVCTLQPGMDGASITVAFRAIQSCTVNVSTNSFMNGEGSIDCGNTVIPMSASYDISAAHNSNLQLVARPDAGCVLYSWVVDGAEYRADGNSLTLLNITGDVSVKAVFRRMNYQLSVETEGGGKVRAAYSLTINGQAVGDTLRSGSASVRGGSAVTVTVTPDADQCVTSFTVNGEAAGLTNGSYVLEALTENTVIKAVFGNVTRYDVAAPADYPSRGSIDVRFADDGMNLDEDPDDSTVGIAAGGNICMVFQPEKGYTIQPDALQAAVKKAVASADSGAEVAAKITADGCAVTISGVDKALDFSKLECPFVRETGSPAYYTFTLNCGDNGSLEAFAGEVGVESGAKLAAGTLVTVRAAADEHYKLGSFAVNHKAAEAGSLSVTGDTVVDATFVRSEYRVDIRITGSGSGTVKANETSYAAGTYWLAGGDYTFTAAAAQGSTAGSLRVNGSEATQITLKSDIVITAEFEPAASELTYNTPEHGTLLVLDTNGSVIPSGTELPVGTRVIVRAVPDAHYAVHTLTVGGVALTQDSFLVDALRGSQIFCEFSAAEIRVNWTEPENGSLAVRCMPDGDPVENGAYVPSGSALKITATPGSSNFELDELNVTGAVCADNGWYITGQDDVSIRAEFRYAAEGLVVLKPEVRVTWTEPENGSLDVRHMPSGISIENGACVNTGDTLKIVANPESEAYVLDDFAVTGAEKGENDCWYVTDRSAVSITAAFRYIGTEKPTARVTWQPADNGSIRVSCGGRDIANGADVEVGSKLQITAVPTSEYFALDALTVTGAKEEQNGQYTVTGDVSISATFRYVGAPKAAVTWNTPAHGSIEVKLMPSGVKLNSGALVSTGDTIRITANPESEDYVLDDLTVTGAEKGEDDCWYVTDTSAVSITAAFRPVDEEGLPYYLNGDGGRIFIGFSFDLNGDGIYTENEYIAPENTEIRFTKNEKTFDDVQSGWERPYVDYMAGRELLLGVSDSLFGPNKETTRGMAITVIGRLYERSFGEIEAGAESRFPDCKPTDYFTKYTQWAADNHIVEGYTDGKFHPDTLVSREQLAVILFRYAQFLGITDGNTVELDLPFKDEAKISSWAKDGVAYCCANEILGGDNKGMMNPGGAATRAQLAKVVSVFIETAIKAQQEQ